LLSSLAGRQTQAGASAAGRTLKLWLVIFTVLLMCRSASASNVLLLTKAGQHSAYEDQINLASQFYGLDVVNISIGEASESSRIARTLKTSDLSAAVLSTGALELLNYSSILNSLKRADGSRIPLLIVVDESSPNSDILSRWTDNLVTNCRAFRDRGEPWQLTFGSAPNIFHQLSGISIKSSTGPVCGLEYSTSVSKLALASAKTSNESFATFVNVSSATQPEFVIAPMRPDASSRPGDMGQFQETFARMAGFMIFLQFSAGERAWHLPGFYANLTIDDPWLTEPYGNLQYQGLLNEMDKHNFHTTIAFVPWNFDRNDQKIVDLFRNRRDRYSISVHGNNHNHQEFGDYRTQPYTGQVKNAEQALARMETFTHATGIAYDRVMVFPHAIAPAETLKILKADQYWATVNSENIPLGSSAPSDPLFVLRPWTLFYDEFLSIRRTSAEVPVRNANIAINAFLGNPQLFYVHQEVFERGIDAFNPVADEVNRLEPTVQWKGLGEIVTHLYLIRMRPDKDYDVLALSPNIVLANPTSHRIVCHIRKPEISDVRSVAVDGAAIDYAPSEGDLRFDVVLEPNQHRRLEVVYGAKRDLAEVDISKRSLVVAFDRRLSDFRDMTLSRSSSGRRMQLIYYKYGFGTILKLIGIIALIFILIICIPVTRILIARRKHARERRNLASNIGAV
jgi:hypothetical protein